MSLIITNKETLKNVAIIVLSNNSVNLSTSTIGDFTLIKSGSELVGINVFNYEKYFDAKNGAHTINKSQIDALQKNGIQIDNCESKFTVGEVMERITHPKSEKLFVLKVKTDKELQIVTNSLNSTVGKKVVVANVGATLPSGIPITLSKVMGIESQGMLCGGETLGKEKTDGVLIVDQEVGSKYIL